MNEESSILSSEPIGRLMRRYAIPCIISLLVAALYNIVDQIYIGWGVGAEGNSATNIVFPLTVLALALATMIGDGACSFISIRLGAGDRDNAAHAAGCAVTLSVLTGLVLMAVYLIFADPLLRLFGAGEDVSALTRGYAKDYFVWISIGIPFYLFGQAMNPIIRSDGSPRLAMAATLAGAVANIILDPIAIFVLDWGVRGAAIATVVGQVITAGISLWCIVRMKSVRLARPCLRLSGGLMRQFLPLGFTSFLSQFSLVLSMAVMNNMMMKYGALSRFATWSDASGRMVADIPLAVQGIVMKYYQIVISVVVGMAAGCIPIVGYNFGAREFLRCRAIERRLMACEAAVGAVALLAFELIPVPLIRLFGSDNPQVYFDFARVAFRIYLCMTVLDCVNKAAFIFLQSLGRALTSTLLSLLREVVLAVPLAIVLPYLAAKTFGAENGVYGLLISMPCSAIITFVFTAIVLLRTGKRLRAQ